MKKFFSFISKIISAATLLGVVFYCVGYFLYSKTKKISNLFSKNDEDNV